MLGACVKNYEDEVQAYTVAELGEMLVKLGIRRMPAYHNGDWYHPYFVEPGKYSCILFPTEAQARAALLIHVLEQEKENL